MQNELSWCKPVRVLLDECVPKRFRMSLLGHEVKTVTDMGWSGIKNGELLKRAQRLFQVMITVDQKMEHQQNLQKYDIGLIVIIAPNNRLETLRACAGDVLTAIDKINPGELVKIQV